MRQELSRRICYVITDISCRWAHEGTACGNIIFRPCAGRTVGYIQWKKSVLTRRWLQVRVLSRLPFPVAIGHRWISGRRMYTVAVFTCMPYPAR